MFGLGTPEIIVILALALILFGPKKLPEIGKSIGQGMRELKKASRDVMDEIESIGDEVQDVKESVKDAADSHRDS